MDPAPAEASRSRLSFVAVMLALTAAFIGLGTWQVQRLFWKLDLIERVEARVHAAPAEAPGPAQWSGLNAADAEYRSVTATGRLLYDREVLVQAVTERGAGFWVVTPLRRTDGTIILINRGFVPADGKDRSARAEADIADEVKIAGLLRMDEPGGAFLRTNDPAGDRWFSRDIQAIAEAKGLADAAPYFIDADGTPNKGGLPVGGMTIVKFRNSHLVYALTWYALAAMSAGAAFAIYRRRFG